MVQPLTTRTTEINKFVTGPGGSTQHALKSHAGGSRQTERKAGPGVHGHKWSALGFPS